MPRSRLPYKLLNFHNSDGILIQIHQVSYLLFSHQQGLLRFNGSLSIIDVIIYILNVYAITKKSLSGS